MPLQLVKHDNKTATQSDVKSKKLKIKPKSNRCYYLIGFGGVGIVLGLILLALQATIMSFIAEKILYLGSDSAIFKMWQQYPMEFPYTLTFFNWTNHEDFFNKSIKPKFVEIGPYRYLQKQEKVDLVRNYNNNTITFKQFRTYRYDNDFPNNGNLSDRIITINYFKTFAAHLIRDWDDAMKDVLLEYISSLDPYYHFDTMVDNELLKGNNNLLMELLHYWEFLFPRIPRMDGVAWLKVRSANSNFEGVYNIANGINRQFDVLNWNYRNTSPYFNGSCGVIKGSLGDIYSYPLNKEYIAYFSGEVCRFLKFYFEEEVIVDGILGYKYSLTKLSLDNGTLNPENKCNCDGPCAPSGLIGMSSCLFNLNLNFSLANFYNADPVYLDAIEGLHPEKLRDESYIVVEPNSLICLKVKIAAQINVFLYPVGGMSYFNDFPELNFPLVRIDVRTQLPDYIKKYLNMYLNISYYIIAAAIIFMALGISGTFYGLYKLKQLHSLERSQNMKYDLIKT